MTDTPRLFWIVGASTGIGAETARQLAARGDHVVISARSEDKLKALAAEQPDRIFPLPVDATDPAAMQTAAEQIRDRHGPLDTAIFNAGTYRPDTAENFSVETVRMHVDLNLMGGVHGVAAVLPEMRRRGQGRIVLVASVAGYRGLPRSISYSSTKAALIAMAESLRVHCQPLGICVQVVCPGFVKTPLTDKNDFPMPMLMDVDKAAAAFIRGLDSDRFEITFPRLFAWIVKRLSRLPYGLYFWLMRQGLKGRG